MSSTLIPKGVYYSPGPTLVDMALIADGGGHSWTTGVTATQGGRIGALQLHAYLNFIDGVQGPGSGVSLPKVVGGQLLYVFNRSASDITIWTNANSADTILGVGASETLPAGTTRTYVSVADGWIEWIATTGTGSSGPFLPLSGGTVSPGKLYTGADVTWSGANTSSGTMGYFYTLAEIVAGAPPGDGGGALTTITRASDYNVAKFGGNPQAYSITSYALADIATGTAECAYFEARTVNTTGTAIGIELDVGNYAGPAPTCNPYQVNNVGCTIGMILAAGGWTGTPGPKWDSSAALSISHNSTKWGRGIVFQAGSTTGEDGTTGKGIAIEFGKGHEVKWTVDTLGTRSGFLRSDTAAGSNSIGLVFGVNTLSYVTSDVAETTLAQLTTLGNFSCWTISTGSSIASGANVSTPAGSGYVVSAGPTIRAGSGAASGTQPAGSLWLRTDGATGSRLYVSAGGGTWAAVAGV